MAPISERARHTLPSPTLTLSARMRALQAEGVDVIAFGAGEPDFDTPQPVRDAAIEALRSGFTRYTAASGIAPLKDAIIAKMERDHGLAYDRNQVIVSCGAKHSLYNFLQAVVNPGDEVVIPRPYWVSYPEQVKLAGGKPVCAEAPEKNGFRLTADAIAEVITPRTTVIVLNSPANPTGAVLPRDELERIADLVVTRDLLVLSDEIYEQLTYGVKHVSIASLGQEIRERAFVVNGFSKAYAMTGWRLGWLCGDADVVAAMGRIQDQSTSNPNSFAQRGAVVALTGDQGCVAEMRAAFQERRDEMVDLLNAIPGISCVLPEGAFYAFANVSGLLSDELRDSDALAEHLLNEAKVGVIPGSGFGAPEHVRLSYATSMEAIREGLERLDAAAARLVG